MQSTNGQTEGSKYKRWVLTYLADQYPRLDPGELYKMRCSPLHQGTSTTITYSRIIFCGPGTSPRIHNGLINYGDDQVLLLDLPTFCFNVIDAVRRWTDEVNGTQNYQRNIENVMRWHPQGIEPYVRGGPVLT